MVCLSSPPFPVTSSVPLSNTGICTPTPWQRARWALPQYNWSLTRSTWTLPPRPIYGAFRWTLLVFSQGEQRITAQHRPPNHKCPVWKDQWRKSGRTIPILLNLSFRDIWKVNTKLHATRKKKKPKTKKKFQWSLTHLIDGWRKGRERCS